MNQQRISERVGREGGGADSWPCSLKTHTTVENNTNHLHHDSDPYFCLPGTESLTEVYMSGSTLYPPKSGCRDLGCACFGRWCEPPEVPHLQVNRGYDSMCQSAVYPLWTHWSSQHFRELQSKVFLSFFALWRSSLLLYLLQSFLNLWQIHKPFYFPQTWSVNSVSWYKGT